MIGHLLITAPATEQLQESLARDNYSKSCDRHAGRMTVGVTDGDFEAKVGRQVVLGDPRPERVRHPHRFVGAIVARTRIQSDSTRNPTDAATRETLCAPQDALQRRRSCSVGRLAAHPSAAAARATRHAV
jgi:hypothetical protein